MSALAIVGILIAGACALALPVIAIASCIAHWNDEPDAQAPATPECW